LWWRFGSTLLQRGCILRHERREKQKTAKCYRAIQESPLFVETWNSGSRPVGKL